MNNRRFVGVAALAAVCVATPISTAQGATLREKYRHRYDAVAAKHGARTPGRDILKQGVRFTWVSKDGQRHHAGSRPARPAELARSVRTFTRWLAPPIHRAAVTDRYPVRASAVGYATKAPQYAGGKWSIPASIVQCESGGDYRAVNPSSGAGGAYQILPSTWAAMGGSGRPQDASPAEQDRIAAKVWQVQGRGAWVC